MEYYSLDLGHFVHNEKSQNVAQYILMRDLLAGCDVCEIEARFRFFCFLSHAQFSIAFVNAPVVAIRARL